jgi:outer membrane protein assembly factor BamB
MMDVHSKTSEPRRMAMKKILVLLSLAVFVVSAPAQTPDWPQWRGPNGSGATTETGWNPMALQGGARVLWKVFVGIGYASPIIKAGRLYTTGGGASKGVRFWCLDPATGVPIWEKFVDLGDRFLNAREDFRATPATDGERVYWISGSGRFFCLRAADGELLWMKELVKDYGAVKPYYGWAASPVIEGDLLLVNAHTLALGLDKATGDIRWRSENLPIIADGLSTPVVCDVGGVRCALFAGANSLLLIEVATGKKLWAGPIAYTGSPAWCAPDPVVSEGKAFFETYEGSRVFDLTKGPQEPLWQSDALTSLWATPVLIDGYLYGVREKGAATAPGDTNTADWPFQCVEFSTGKIVWEKNLPWVSATVAGGKLILLEFNGILHIAEVTPGGYRDLSVADILKGAKVARTFRAPPVLWGGKIYCRNYDGDLVCIDVSR